MKDTLGDRMKNFYEDRFRYYLPRRAYTIIRVDGKAFHSYTKGLSRPFDFGLISDMDQTAAYLCKNIMGAKFAYVQSDEISVLLTDFDDLSTQAWFDNNLQKMASVASSMATVKFNELRLKRNLKIMEDIRRPDEPFLDLDKQKLAMFDARVFQIPSAMEVENYFIWRQQDATRNSISSVAQSMFSHKELHGKSTDEMQEMIFQEGINWNDYLYREKRGGVVSKVEVKVPNVNKLEAVESTNITPEKMFTTRTKWEAIETPIFTQDREFLRGLIPNFSGSRE